MRLAHSLKPIACLAAVACLAVSALADPPDAPVSAGTEAVRVVAVEPDTVPFHPNGRFLDGQAPARFCITLQNATAVAQSGTLAAEAVGHLGTVYEVARERVSLAPNEKRIVTLVWTYPVGIEFDRPVGPVRLPGATWGHRLNAAWIGPNGHVVSQGWTVFAIQNDGTPAGTKRPASTEPFASARDAFLMRFCGYLKNPAIAALTGASDVQLECGGKQVPVSRQGTGPTGDPTYICDLPPAQRAEPAVVTCSTPGHRLTCAWLLEPDEPSGPRARRLFHRTDGKTFTFTVPQTKRAALIVLETGLTHSYIAPAPLAEIAEAGRRKFGAVPSMLLDEQGRTITTPAQWEAHRKEMRAAIWKALGVAPVPASVPFDPTVVSEERVPAQAWPTGVTHSYVRRKVSIVVRPGERMNVSLLIPDGIGPFPAVVALHQTVEEGKDEPLGQGGMWWILNYGPFLASRGYVVIAPDSVTTGDRRNRQSTDGPYQTPARFANDPNWSMLGERTRDHVRVLDYLVTLPFVDVSRIGAIGHSLGGESTSVLTAMDDRIRAAVESCGFTLMRTFPDAADIYAPPNARILSENMRKLLLKPVGERKLPFDFDTMMALWAPRAMFMHDVRDELWANAAQVAQCAEEAQKVYKLLGAEDHFYVIYSNQNHCFPGWVQPDAYDWLDYWLQPRTVVSFALPPAATSATSR